MKTEARFNNRDYIVAAKCCASINKKKILKAFNSIDVPNAKKIQIFELHRICADFISNCSDNEIAARYLQVLKFMTVTYSYERNIFESIYVPEWLLIRVVEIIILKYNAFISSIRDEEDN